MQKSAVAERSGLATANAVSEPREAKALDRPNLPLDRRVRWTLGVQMRYGR